MPNDMVHFRNDMSHEEIKKFIKFYNDRLELPGSMMLKGGPKDYIGAAMSLSATLFFRWGWTKNNRIAICQCLEDYLAIAGDKIKWVYSDESPNELPHQAYHKTKNLRQLYELWDEDTPVIRQYKGGDRFRDASPYSFFIGTHSKWETERDERYDADSMDVLSFSLPASTLKDHPTLFQELIIKFAQTINASHGFGGFKLELSPDTDNEDPSEAWLAQKMNGISVGSDYAAAGSLNPTKLKTVSWLTVIGNDLLSEYSDTWLRSELPPSWFAFYKYDVGLIIQAGNTPEIAQLPDNAHPATYVLPNMVFKPNRTEYCTIHYNTQRTPLITGSPAVELWLSRFDVPDEQLIEYKHKLTQMPVLKKKHVLYDAVDPHFQHLYR